MAARANQGLYGEQSQGEKKADAPAEPAAGGAKEDAAQPPAGPDLSELARKAHEAKGLNRDGFVPKLTGGLSSPVAAAAAQARPLTQEGIRMQLANTFAGPLGRRSKAEAFPRAMRAINAQKMGAARGRASRAMGQLKMAKALSGAGSASPAGEGARQYAADAFEQQASQGASGTGAGTGSMPASVAPVGTGSGASDVTETPSVGGSGNQTPYQSNLDDAKKKTGSALMLTIFGGILLAIGTALVIFAKNLAATGIGSLAASHWMMIGIALILAGLGMLIAGVVMSNSAKNEGRTIANQYGQKDQGKIVDECADQAVKKENCKPKTSVDDKLTNPGVSQAVKDESGASFDFDNGQPVGN
jgi:hypothetical protein